MTTRALELAARTLMALAVLVCIGGGLLWLSQRPWFAIKRIEVRGDLQHVTQTSIAAALAGRLRGNFFSLPLEDARRAFEAVPWVAAASVRRSWPDRLVVSLTEHRPLGLWDDGRLLSETGRLFVANAAEAELHGPLIDFAGPERLAADAAQRYFEFAPLLAPLALELEAVRVSERAAWSLRARGSNGITHIELGRDEPPGRLRTQIDSVIAAYPELVARSPAPIARIDARYANGLAVAASATRPRKP
jgi:cell division protein FtsQ